MNVIVETTLLMEELRPPKQTVIWDVRETRRL